MNCANCGAPVSVVPGREHLECEFCETLHFLSESEGSPDRVSLLARETGRHCPVCATALREGKLDRQRVEGCPQCRGFLLRQPDFADILERRRRSYQGPHDPPTPLNPQELNRRIQCPQCDRPMETYPYFGPGNAVLDSCLACRLIWLDPGELTHLERAPGVR